MCVHCDMREALLPHVVNEWSFYCGLVLRGVSLVGGMNGESDNKPTIVLIIDL